MSINRASISGNLTRDSELRATQGGTNILSFGVAVNDRRRNAQGEWEDRPNYIDCVMFGARAQAMQKFLLKGTKVAIEGKLRYSSCETKDGQRRSKVEVVVDEIELMSQRDGARASDDQCMENYTGQVQNGAQNGSESPSGPVQTELYDEDIPF